MQPTDKKKAVPTSLPWIRTADEWSLLALAVSLLVMSLCYWWYLASQQGTPLKIDRAEPLSAAFQIDINTADWPEIIQLPGLGETMARRILSERNIHGPFQRIDELVRVDGIGPKTLAKIRPYLLPLSRDTARDVTASGAAETAP